MIRDDFIFTIGFQGDTAVVDRTSKRKYAGKSALELLEAGLYKPAFCAALSSEDAAEMEQFVRVYREKTGRADASPESLKRLYGVFENPTYIKRVLLV